MKQRTAKQLELERTRRINEAGTTVVRARVRSCRCGGRGRRTLNQYACTPTHYQQLREQHKKAKMREARELKAQLAVRSSHSVQGVCATPHSHTCFLAFLQAELQRGKQLAEEERRNKQRLHEQTRRQELNATQSRRQQRV